MSLQLKLFQIRNFELLHQTSGKVASVFSYLKSSQYSTASAETAPSASAKPRTAKPFSEIPGINTFTAVKEFILGKVAKHKTKHIVFDSRQSFKFWKSLKDVYGPTFRITLVGQPKFVVITNPDDIEILYRITMNEPVRPGLYSLKKIRNDAADNLREKRRNTTGKLRRMAQSEKQSSNSNDETEKYRQIFKGNG
ncbi:hypothetical protein Avbf_08632 [Armadillidium vulgare]|nr:hypothetical protein Avbf_08632 [Armadillidium vulgare]